MADDRRRVLLLNVARFDAPDLSELMLRRLREPVLVERWLDRRR